MDIGGSAKAKTSHTTQKQTQEQQESSNSSSQLKLDDKAITKIIEDTLGSADGLASIFAGEQTAGIFDSSVAAQASGDLAANIIGELAKITGETVTNTDTNTARTGKTSENENETEAGASFKLL